MSIPSTSDDSGGTEPLVGIVTPFFADAAWLEKTIESVLGQTYGNWEYILVDNHAPELVRAVAERYARQDRRIKLVRTPARLSKIDRFNFAFEQISAACDWVKLVDEGDWLFDDSLRQMLELATEHPKVAVVSSYWLGEKHMGGVGLKPECTVISGKEACRLHLLGGAFLFGSPSTLLYRSDLLAERQPFFPSGRVHADTETVFELLTNVDFGFVHQVLSCCRGRAEPPSPPEFQPDALDRFIIVSQYGPAYLDTEEFNQCLNGATRWYYSVLARAWISDQLGGAPPGFWEYQRAGLKTIGEEVRPQELIPAVIRRLGRSALTPLESLRLAKAARGRRSG